MYMMPSLRIAPAVPPPLVMPSLKEAVTVCWNDSGKGLAKSMMAGPLPLALKVMSPLSGMPLTRKLMLHVWLKDDTVLSVFSVALAMAAQSEALRPKHKSCA
jgi:hypothetical protein